MKLRNDLYRYLITDLVQCYSLVNVLQGEEPSKVALFYNKISYMSIFIVREYSLMAHSHQGWSFVRSIDRLYRT